MEPIFTVETVVSGENYRKGIKKIVFPYVAIVTYTLVLIYIINVIFPHMLELLGEPRKHFITILIIILYVDIIAYFIYRICTFFLRIKKYPDHCVAQLVFASGTSEPLFRHHFYEGAVCTDNHDSEGQTHVPYDSVTKIYYFNEFVFIVGTKHHVCISYRDIPDIQRFRNFIEHKCLNAKRIMVRK